MCTHCTMPEHVHVRICKMYMHARACTLCKIINVLTHTCMLERSYRAYQLHLGGGHCPPKRNIGGAPAPPPSVAALDYAYTISASTLPSFFLSICVHGPVCEIGGCQVAQATCKRSLATYFDQLVAIPGDLRIMFAYFALLAHDTYCTTVHV